jgi:hypothetical protein
VELPIAWNNKPKERKNRAFPNTVFRPPWLNEILNPSILPQNMISWNAKVHISNLYELNSPPNIKKIHHTAKTAKSKIVILINIGRGRVFFMVY